MGQERQQGQKGHVLHPLQWCKWSAEGLTPWAVPGGPSAEGGGPDSLRPPLCLKHKGHPLHTPASPPNTSR